MNVLKSVKHEIIEDPATKDKWVKVSTPGILFPKTEQKRKTVRNPDRQVHLRLWISKQFYYTWDFDPEDWAIEYEVMSVVPRFIGKGIAEAPGEFYYFYGYEGHFFMSEIELEPQDVPILISRQQTMKKERLQKEVEHIKAMAESEGGVRVPISDDVQILVWNRDGGKCVKCGSQELLEFDHIIPFSKGGSNSARNIQLLCQKCNRTKLDKIGG